MLVDIPSTMTISSFVRGLKSRTSAEFISHPLFPDFSGWAVGYGAFSISHFDIDRIKQYIINQEIHHSGVSFEAEFEELLKQNGFTVDEYTFAD